MAVPVWGSSSSSSPYSYSNQLRNLFTHTKLINPTFLITLLILSSLSYFLGSYRRTSTTSAPLSTSCFTPNNSSNPLPVPLDFSSHHFIPLPTEAHAPHFPPCHRNLSEYTPCHDPKRALRFRRQGLRYLERHCPEEREKLRCRIPPPYGYKTPVPWPASRDNVWFANVPHKWLTVEKAGQNWVRFEVDRFTFPGGGTMFRGGANVYINEIGKVINLNDGSVRTAIDTGCGVASWGAYLLSRSILTMSFAPNDNHEAQIQFALERGVPAMIGIMAAQRLSYPSRSFDMAHCSRCLIPWTQYEGMYLMEVDRILRPGGYWILSGPPINWEAHWKGWNRTKEDLRSEQSSIETVAKSLCWKKVKQRGDIAVWQKPANHIHCKMSRDSVKKPPFCNQTQDPDRAWYTEMEACLSPLPEVSSTNETAGGELAKWPERLTAVPPRVSIGTLEGITPEVFKEDTQKWKNRLSYYKRLSSELKDPGRYRNVLDMNANLGGFAAALVHDLVWVMNVVPVEAKVNTLGVVYERGLIGTYQSWCEAMSTYPRTYDLIHADSVFSLYEDRCKMEDILLEMDRILRPKGSIIWRDDVDVLVKVKKYIDEMKYNTRIYDHEEGPLQKEKIMVALKQYWTSPAPTPSQTLS